MIDLSKLVFLPLDMQPPPDISKYLDTLRRDHESDISDDYRASPSILLMTREGEWFEHVDLIPKFKHWAETILFKDFPRSQMVVIVTQPSRSMEPHIDCSPKNFHTLQHKFRYVFRGNVSDLRWLKSDGESENTPQTDGPYVISGRWPHDMINSHPEVKYTLCLGAPWEPTMDDEQYVSVLERAYAKHSVNYLSSEGWGLPENWEELFNQKKYPRVDGLLPIKRLKPSGKVAVLLSNGLDSKVLYELLKLVHDDVTSINLVRGSGRDECPSDISMGLIDGESEFERVRETVLNKIVPFYDQVWCGENAIPDEEWFMCHPDAPERGTKEIDGNYYSPFLFFDKSKIISLALEYGIDVSGTISCTEESNSHCRECWFCKEREFGFKPNNKECEW